MSEGDKGELMIEYAPSGSFVPSSRSTGSGAEDCFVDLGPYGPSGCEEQEKQDYAQSRNSADHGVSDRCWRSCLHWYGPARRKVGVLGWRNSVKDEKRETAMSGCKGYTYRDKERKVIALIGAVRDTVDQRRVLTDAEPRFERVDPTIVPRRG